MLCFHNWGSSFQKLRLVHPFSSQRSIYIYNIYIYIIYIYIYSWKYKQWQKIYSKLPHFLPMTQIDNCIENWPHRPKFAMDNFLTDRWASQQETSNYFEGFPASHVWFPNIIIISHYCCLYPHDCSGIVVQSKPPFIDDVPLTTSISTGFSHWNLNFLKDFPS